MAITYVLGTDGKGHFSIAPILDYHNPIYIYNQYNKYTPIDSKEFDNEIINIEFTLLEWLQELRNMGVLNRKNIPSSKTNKIR
ncbi:MAG: hypothetical protein WB511_06575 [Nitrososphaeraceae archaeon]|jgi:hypothetical protein